MAPLHQPCLVPFAEPGEDIGSQSATELEEGAVSEAGHEPRKCDRFPWLALFAFVLSAIALTVFVCIPGITEPVMGWFSAKAASKSQNLGSEFVVVRKEPIKLSGLTFGPTPFAPPAPNRELGYNQLHFATAVEEVKSEFYPAICSGQALQAGFTLAGLAIKAIAASRECNTVNYECWNPFNRDPQCDGRRLSDLTEEPVDMRGVQVPLRKFKDALVGKLHKLPGAPYYEEVMRNGQRKALQERNNPIIDYYGGVRQTYGETAYNVTEWDLALKNTSFVLDGDWTFEGWHFLSKHQGVVFDTRDLSRGTHAPGIAACLKSDGTQELVTSAAGQLLASPPGTRQVPLNNWTHLVWQKRAGSLEFFVDGQHAGTFPAPRELGRLGVHVNVLLGSGADRARASKLHGLVSNMRLTGRAVYSGDSFTPETNLTTLPETHFLLKDGYQDKVSGHQVHVEGSGSNANISAVGNRQLHGGLGYPKWSRTYGNWALPDGKPDIIGPVEQRDAWCARTVLTIIKDAGTIASSIESMLKTCQDQKTYGMKCASSATKTIRAAANAGKFLAEFPVRGCSQKWSEGYYKCSTRMEGAAWAFDVLGTELGETINYCQVPTSTEPKPGPYINWGACVGEVVSSCSYIAAAGMNIGSATTVDCPNTFTLKQKQAWLADPEEGAQIFNKQQVDCARDSTSFVRTLFLAGAKAARAGGSCSGLKTLCAQNALLSAAAFAGIGQVGTILHKRCVDDKHCCNWDKAAKKVVCDCSRSRQQSIWAKNRRSTGECARYSGAMAKLIGSSISFAAEAHASCFNSSNAQDACASMIPFIIASFGYFAENAARNYYECPYYSEQNLYNCGQDQSKIGGALERAAGSIAAAVINCGVATQVPVPRLVGMVHPPRRFFTP